MFSYRVCSRACFSMESARVFSYCVCVHMCVLRSVCVLLRAFVSILKAHVCLVCVRALVLCVCTHVCLVTVCLHVHMRALVSVLKAHNAPLCVWAL